MDVNGNRIIAADRKTVWKALNSAEVLQSSIPGCTELTGSPEDGFEAIVTQKVGPVKATFKGTVTLTDIVEGESYRLNGAGKGGAAGFAKGGAAIRLEDVEGGTNLIYEVEAKVGGKLAQLGSRVIHGVAVKLANQFFDNFEMIVAPPKEVADEIEGVEEEKPAKGWFGKLLDWIKKLTG
ncbi:MAG: carbon monoxide dehydrogenase subunit G [Rhodobacteraceae bacterium]|nr:carbon monoxide dehydrogenase subunit G [Paracoccaceae bacterium]